MTDVLVNRPQEKCPADRKSVANPCLQQQDWNQTNQGPISSQRICYVLFLGIRGVKQ